MIVTPKTKMLPDRRALTQQAMQASIRARQVAGLDLHSPICIYGLSEAHRVTVRFNDIASMEGMYERGSPSRIHLSALRPLPRRAYNCGHELGHHVFGHGSTIDELREDVAGGAHSSPNEILADAFAAFALMPTLGVRRGFAARGGAPASATPRQVFAVACEFGVGYATLVTHLAYALGEMPRAHAARLLRATPRSLREEILGAVTPSPLVVADHHWAAPTLDAEVGTLLLLPPGTQVAGAVAAAEGSTGSGSLFRAVSPGVARATVPGTPWATFVRVARPHYVGLAQYRHLEDHDDD
ncbi:ImmA/IrrE family metallo-endopeptidase [Roseomonas sp. HF4]|uniref:ImmA/IrrE family metallo-endopeptidase n=1 Tax=Roseomonas sp. HF4 TaxID=2562313 RepID=UPI001981D533|nr:ImmA/IrrE family metallo-endopeptidase [Roseomonas sp. HF4]